MIPSVSLQYQQPPQQQHHYQHRQHSRDISTYSKKCANILGSLYILAGFACLVMETAYILMPNKGSVHCTYWLFSGLWTGLIHIISGLNGIISSMKSSTCRVVTFLVLSIISAFFATSGFFFAMHSAAVLEEDLTKKSRSSYDYTDIMGPRPTYFNASDVYNDSLEVVSTSCSGSRSGGCRPSQGARTLQQILALVQAAQVFLAVAGSVLCCRVTCCRGPPATTYTTVHYQVVPGSAGSAPGYPYRPYYHYQMAAPTATPAPPLADYTPPAHCTTA